MTIGEQISLKMENKKIKFLKKTKISSIPTGHYFLDITCCHIFQRKQAGLKVIHEFSKEIGIDRIYKINDIVYGLDHVNGYYLTPHKYELNNMRKTLVGLIINNNLNMERKKCKQTKLQA